MPDTQPPRTTLERLRRLVGDTDPQSQIWSDTILTEVLNANSFAGAVGVQWDVSGAVVDLLTEHLGELRKWYDFKSDGKEFSRSNVFKQTRELIETHTARRRVRSAGSSRGDIA